MTRAATPRWQLTDAPHRNMQPAARAALNEDIWSTILSLVDPGDAQSLSLVSRSVHPAARRAVLSCADISSQSQLEHACAFMIAEPHHRACWLRELFIDQHALDALEHRWDSAEGLSLAAQLADLLAATQNITSLALPSVESILAAEPRVGTALAALARLEFLSLSGVLTRALAVANTMASRPSEVALVLGDPPNAEHAASTYLVLLSHLALLRNARVVEIEFFDMTLDVYVKPKQPSDFAFLLRELGQHPSVRELCLRNGGPLPLFHIFPNIQTLHMRCLHESFAGFDWRAWAWTASVPLVDVSADDDDELACLVGPHGTPTLRQLYLHQPPSLLRAPDRAFNADDLRPVCLTFHLEEWHAPWNTDLPLWDGYLEDPAGAEGRLRYLQVTAQCHSDEDVPVQWVEWLLPALQESALVCVRLNFEAITPSGTVVKLDEARQMLVEHVPSLRYLCIAQGQCPLEDLEYAHHPRLVGECAWWRVHEGAGERRVESISCEAGERVERYLRSAEFEATLSLDGFVPDEV
ncbi:uncharacterized protein C8Q71DRAFT_843880 [Rhodofomes roseus]|uniref:F-box domain-containing protein n=1 Tax=Rhodofomes roseus TaxID=34475 RepID=A0ABQ8JYM0_9APHY|nr:uncharacterized protein C8Q71DRAFT_843880 [Rhodofomes roseus]KAH9829353.1 hypothetical protein C8Q71DRAFT_843880 [Rhodofomes roseus]